MSSASRVPLLVGSKGRKPTRLPIAPRARPSNDRMKRPTTSEEVASTASMDTEDAKKDTKKPAEPHGSPEQKALPAVLPVATLSPLVAPTPTAPTPTAPRTVGGISPGHSISASRAPVTVRPQAVAVGSARSPMLTGRSPGQPVERLAKITSKTAIPLFRPQEARTHASPILGPRATPIPAPHGTQAESHDQNQLLKRLTRKLDIKPHQSPRRAALNHTAQNGVPNASPLMLSAPASATPTVPLAPLDPTSNSTPKKRAAKRRIPESTQEIKKSAANKPARRSLRRKVKKEGSYMDPSDSNNENENGEDDDDYEHNDGGDDMDEGDSGLDLPELANPPVYMPARERATLWAKKVLRHQEDVENGTVTEALVKKERRKRSNSTSSVASLATNATNSSRKSKADELLKKEPSQMTMGELAMSIPKGRRMLRHEQEENADHNGQNSNSLHRVRSLSMSSETPSFGGGSFVTPQVQIIDGKMVISEATVKINENDQPAPDYTDDSVRRPRGARYLAANITPGRRWGKDETKQFYYCLSQVGPNFSMMATLFPTRKRKELKSKFKYEEKHHPELIEIALKASAAPLDSEIVDVIAQMADKETKKREEKRRKHSEGSLESGLNSPATVSSSAVPTPPPGDVMDSNEDEEFVSDFYRERKNSFDFAG